MLGGRARLVVRLTVAALAVSPWLAAQPAPAATTPLRIMLVGDSITEGSSGDWTWRYRLARYLDSAGVDYEFVGPRTAMFDQATGEHTSEDYPDPAFDQHHFAWWGMSLHAILDENAPTPESSIGWAVSTYQPDVVIEALGINDTLYGSPPQETVDVAEQFVQEVRAARPDASIVLSTVPDTQYAHVTDFNTLLASTAPTWSTPTSRVLVSDPSPGWDAAQDTCDNTHPSAVGEVKIAAAQADALAAWGIGEPAARPLPAPPVGPRQPAALTATPGDGQVTLSWQLPPGGTGVLVSTRDVTRDEAWHRLPYGLGGDSWVAGGLTNGDTYSFRVNVLKHDCLAADVDSDVATTVPEPDAPGAVSGLAATSSDHGFTASWAATPGATSYAVWYESADSTPGWTSLTTPGTTMTVAGLVAGAPYRVAVQAINPGGAGPLSAPQRVVPSGLVPAPPVWSKARASADGSAVLAWAPVTGADRYAVTSRLHGQGRPWRTPVRTSSPRTMLAGLRDGARYDVRVRAYDGRIAGPWGSVRLLVVPRVGPVEGVTVRRRSATEGVTRGEAVPFATSYLLRSATSASCGRVPRAGLFRTRAQGLSTPDRIFRLPARQHVALWVRWYAVRNGVPGHASPASVACLLLR
jgi:hypothetical protein